MTKAIIFDCFGVLTTDGWLPFKQKYFGQDSQLFDEAGSLNHQHGSGLIGLTEFYERIAALAKLTPREVQAQVDGSVPNIELFEYIRDTLKPNYKIGMLSNAGVNYLEQLFTHEQVALFDEVALSYEIGAVKPHRSAYDIVLDKLGVTADEAIFIDDQERHCTGAREAGIHAVQYQDFAQMRHDLEAALKS